MDIDILLVGLAESLQETGGMADFLFTPASRIVARRACHSFTAGRLFDLGCVAFPGPNGFTDLDKPTVVHNKKYGAVTNRTKVLDDLAKEFLFLRPQDRFQGIYYA
jgi:hypothetical protein